MYTTIQPLGSEGHTLVEDGESIRLLVADLRTTSNCWQVPQAVWHEAHAAGAAAIVGELNGGWAFILAERFMDTREDEPPYYRFRFEAINQTEPPSYRDLLEAEVIEVGPDPVEIGDQFVHLHTHSEHSPPDGYSTVKEIVEIAVAQGCPAVGLADHGSCAGHIELQQECDEAGIKPIFAIEAYFQDDRHIHNKDTRYAYWHLVLIAMNDVGLTNLWALSTEGFRDGLYDGKPRIDWDSLQRYQEGLICTTACLRGPVAKPILDSGDEEAARINFARLQEIFGDRLYTEIHTNQLDKQIKINHLMVEWSRAMGVRMIASVDSHYPHSEDHINHQAMLVLRRKKVSIEDDVEGGMFAGDGDYSLINRDKVANSLAYLAPDVVDECLTNTVTLTERCTAKIVPLETIPVYSNATEEWPDPIAHDADRLIEVCLSNWQRKIVGKPYSEETAAQRLEEELALINSKKFPGYFLIVHDYVWAAKHRDQLDSGLLDAIEARIPEPPGGYRRTPILVGPGRGSGGGSIVAYLSDITEIDPLDADLLFARFMTPGRKELPDFDLDFPATEREWIKEYVRQRWGQDHVITVGTVGRMQVKASIKEVARIFKDRYSVQFTDVERMAKVADVMSRPLAGAALKWEDFEEDEQVQAYATKYPEMWALSAKFYHRWRAYGQHPAGVIISTDAPLTGTLPLRVDKEGALVAQWDMEALGWLGKVKFDLLTVRNLDTVQTAIDLVHERFGVRIDPYEWRIEHEDPQVWEELATGHTLGVFQVETVAGTRMCKDFGPRSMQDLTAVTTLVRPGPKRSGLTATYLKRRRGEEPVSVPDPRLESVLSETLGCMVYQEDIMGTTMVLATYDGGEADGVRKILGKKQVEKVEAAGRVFIARAVENNTDPEVAAALWVQMAEFAKYSFNKAHAYGYSVLSYWTAWFKVHFPVEFLTAALSTVDDDRIPDFVREARRLGYNILPPDINESGMGFTPGSVSIRYGLDAIKGVGEAAVAAILPHQPFASFEDFVTRRGAKCDSGKVRLLVQVGAFDMLDPNRRALEAKVEWETSGESMRCVMRSDTAVNVNGLPCTFDWSTEPIVYGKSGKPIKPKDPPKKCTVRCRHYTPPQPIDVAIVEPYNDADIREIEKTLLGLSLSSTVFDQLDPEDREAFHKVEEIEMGPVGEYIVAGIVARVGDERSDRNGNPFAFIGLETESGMLDVACFSRAWSRYKNDLIKDSLVMAVIEKNNRGISLEAVAPARKGS